jgi:hypothetical protein
MMETFKAILGAFILFQILPVIFYVFALLANEDKKYFYVLGLKISSLAFIVTIMLLISGYLFNIY